MPTDPNKRLHVGAQNDALYLIDARPGNSDYPNHEADRNAIAKVYETDVARRLAACWNAFRGMPTELIEKMPEGGVVELGIMLHEQESAPQAAQPEPPGFLRIERRLAVRGARSVIKALTHIVPGTDGRPWWNLTQAWDDGDLPYIAEAAQFLEGLDLLEHNAPENHLVRFTPAIEEYLK